MKTRWGQNFLVDRNIAEKIVRGASISKADTVVEIGPGKGALTGYIAERAGRLLAVEIDRVLAAGLEKKFRDCDNVKIICEDVLKANFPLLLEDAAPPLKLISNLPYNITSPVLRKILTIPPGFRPVECILMMQKEVAARIAAAPGCKDYSLLTIGVRFRCDVEKMFDVTANSFKPKPRVDSTVLKLTIRQEPLVKVKDEKLFANITKASFAQRRKKFYNTVTSLPGIEREDILAILEKMNISPGIRPERLSIEQFAQIADLLCERGFKEDK